MTDPDRTRRTEPERETVVVERGGGGPLALIGGIVVVLLLLVLGYFWLYGGEDASVDIDVPEVSVDVTPDGE